MILYEAAPLTASHWQTPCVGEQTEPVGEGVEVGVITGHVIGVLDEGVVLPHSLVAVTAH